MTARGLELMTRIGFAARGLTYLLIGYFFLQSGRAADNAAVLASLSSGAGRILLAVMAAGFLGYALWRLSEALIDTEGHGTDTKGVAVRLGGAVSGLLHVGLGGYAFLLALRGAAARNGGDGTQEGARMVLDAPGGALLLGAVALALAATGLYQLIKAAKLDFLRHLSPRVARQSWMRWAGRAGYAARGVTFLAIALFVWRTASESRADEAGGMGEALASLPAWGGFLIAAGLALFGLFSLVEARYRRIDDPKVLHRLAANARRRGF